MSEAGGEATPADLLGDRYELLELLGAGGMADVHRARDHRLGREVAVKMLRESAGDPGERARFIAEARTLAGFSHSGLVTVLDAGFGTGSESVQPPVPADVRPFLVMELVESPTLATRITRGPLAPDIVGSIGAQLADALAYVHDRLVVHRDLKPANVLLGPDSRVKLADFGVARLVGDSSGHTRTGQAIGSPAYLAPEQVTGRDVSGATDVYALGLVLLEALTGSREYPGSAAEAALARLHRPPALPDALPDAWRGLLREMTALEPGDRPTASAVAARLRDQPTGPVPLATERVPDPVTAPLLADEPAPGPAGGSTLVMGGPPAAHPTQGVPAPRIDRAGDALSRRVRSVVGRVRASDSHERGVAGSLAALVLLLTVVALIGGDPDYSGLPSNTPTELRGPLQELHVAVNGDAE